jgi:alkylresorcinol/alkylpyrone synthase
MGAAARDFLGRHRLALGDIDRFVCHPGGPKVIDALEDAFGLGRETLSDARAVLREYGNMSAASVLFVLERALEQAWDRALVTALGPGFTAGFLVLSRG